MSKLGTRTKSSSSRGGASGHPSSSTSSGPLTAGTSLPVSGSGRMAIVPPVETTTTDATRYFDAMVSAFNDLASPNSSSTRVTGSPRNRNRTAATKRMTPITKSVNIVVAVPRA